MSNQLQALEDEAELLKKRISGLYHDYCARVEEILKDEVNSSNMFIIEDEFNNLMVKIRELEQNFKLLCIKTLY
jgi:hypothetical protein